VLAVFGAYAPVVTSDFVNYDDDKHLTGNPRMNPPTLANTAKYWTDPRGFFGLYIPVTYTVWTLVAQLAYRPATASAPASLNPHVFHIANLLLHALNTVVVFAILRRTVREGEAPAEPELPGVPRSAGASPSQGARGESAAMFGALLFALHPMQVEPVAWASGFRDVFGGLLVLLTILQYVRCAQTVSPAARRRHYGVALFLLVAALLAKPTAVIVPIILLIFDVLVMRRPARQLTRALLPMFLLAIAAASLARFTQPSTLLTDPAPLHWRPIIACDAIAFYVYKLVWPATFGVDYGRTPRLAIEHAHAGLTWLAPAALLAIALLLRRRLPMFHVGLLIFLAGLLPVLGFVTFDFQEISTVADRYVYLSMLGAGLALAGLISHVRSRAAWVAASVILFALGARTFAQARTWHGTQALFMHALRVNPRSWLAYTNLGVSETDPRAAETLLRRAIEFNPKYADARIDLGTVLAEQNRLPEAVQEFQIAVKLRPDIADAHANLGLAYSQLGRIDDAVREYEKIPLDDRARRMLPRLRALRGLHSTQPSTAP
jgi:hypothetical protein